ncbi:MAG: hypothetical protein RIA63_04455, partial [Cyclobacteriaceae bacterium]
QTVTINNTHIVTLDVNTAVTLASITINPGGTLITTGAFTVNATTIIIGGTYTNQSAGAVTVTNWTVNGGGTYNHALNGGTIPVASGTRSWAATSNCNITGIISTAPAPAGFAVPAPGFGNLTWNSASQTTNAYLEASFNVQGDFSIIGTGAFDPTNHAVRMSPDGGTYTINVAGNFLVDNNSTFKMNNSSGNCFLNVTGNVTVDNNGFLTLCTGPATSTMTVTGNVDVMDGTILLHEDSNVGALGILDINGNLSIAASASITETDANGSGSILFTGAGTQTFTSAGSMSGEINVSVNSGVRLQMGSASSTFEGTGTFLLPAGAALGITSPDGITTAGATGNVQVSGTRTYSSGANYIYNGSADQNTGNGLTQNTPNNIEVDNAGNTVSLSAATSLTGNLTITAGTLSASSNTVTFNGTGAQVISSTSTSQSFSGLTLNKAAGALSVGGSLTDISTGSILLLSGTFNAPPNLIVGGDFTNNGATFVPGTGTVTFNRPAAQSINGSVLTQTFNDVVVNKAGGASLSAAGLTALNVNNYTQTLGDFTGPPSLNVAGDVLLTAGTFTAGTNTNVSGDWTNNGGAFVPGTNTVTFNGAGPQSINGTAPTQTFNNLVVSKGGGTLTVGGSTATLNASNYAQTAGNFTANTTTNVFGFTIGAGTYTAGTNTNIAGNFTNNGATFDG